MPRTTKPITIEPELVGCLVVLKTSSRSNDDDITDASPASTIVGTLAGYELVRSAHQQPEEPPASVVLFFEGGHKATVGMLDVASLERL